LLLIGHNAGSSSLEAGNAIVATIQSPLLARLDIQIDKALTFPTTVLPKENFPCLDSDLSTDTSGYVST
jgi:hypothetical protein